MRVFKTGADGVDVDVTDELAQADRWERQDEKILARAAEIEAQIERLKRMERGFSPFGENRRSRRAVAAKARRYAIQRRRPA